MFSRIRLIIIIFFATPLSTLISYEYDLSICAIFKDEAPYIKEWIEYHKIIGVEHFYLYNHNSNDDYLNVLDLYLKNNEVTLVDWEYEYLGDAQRLAYEDALTKSKFKSKWLAFIDIDEFLVMNEGQSTIKEFLQGFEKSQNIAGVTVNWQLFGTSWIKKLNPNLLLVEQLVMKAEKKHHRNVFYKSIVRPEFTIKARNPHWFSYKEGYKVVDPNGKRVKSIVHKGIPVDKISINHYWLRDEEFAYSTKVKRLMHVYKWPEDKAIQFIESLFDELNYQEDYTIFPVIPHLREVVFEGN